MKNKYEIEIERLRKKRLLGRYVYVCAVRNLVGVGMLKKIQNKEDLKKYEKICREILDNRNYDLLLEEDV